MQLSDEFSLLSTGKRSMQGISIEGKLCIKMLASHRILPLNWEFYLFYSLVDMHNDFRLCILAQ